MTGGGPGIQAFACVFAQKNVNHMQKLFPVYVSAIQLALPVCASLIEK